MKCVRKIIGKKEMQQKNSFCYSSFMSERLQCRQNILTCLKIYHVLYMWYVKVRVPYVNPVFQNTLCKEPEYTDFRVIF